MSRYRHRATRLPLYGRAALRKPQYFPPPPDDPADLGSLLPARLPDSSGTVQFWVDPKNGSDSTGNGSQALPWETIQKAINTVSAAGTIINVLDGTFTVNSGHWITISNRTISTTNPVTIRAVNRGQVKVQKTSGSAVAYPYYITNSSGWRFEGLRVQKWLGVSGADNPGHYGGRVDNNCKKIEFLNCSWSDIGGDGFVVKGPAGGRCEDIHFYNCAFFPTGTTGVNYDSRGTRYDYAVGVTCTGDYFTSRGTHGCYIGMNYDGDYNQPAGCLRSVWANCLFVGNAPGTLWGPHPQAYESYLVNSTLVFNDVPQFTRGAQNSAWSAGAGALVGSNGYSTTYTTKNMRIVNNIFAHLAGHAVRGDGAGPTNQVFNNLAYDCDNGVGYDGPTNQDYYSDGTSNFTNLGNLASADPLFVLEGRTELAGFDYRLQSSSPAVGQADPDYCPPYDFNGTARTATPSLGAFA